MTSHHFHHTTSSYPQTRMRRLRSSPFMRDLVVSNHLQSNDLIWPLFVVDQKSAYDPVDNMPQIHRLGHKELLYACEQACDLGIPCIALFPVIADTLKDPTAKAAYDPQGLICQSIQRIKQRFPNLGIMADVALDPYTSHGHDGWINTHGYVDNDITISILIRQALAYANAGADIIAPSDMMDGRIRAIRNELEEHGLYHLNILSYAVKYASAFYAPFRHACKAKSQLGPQGKSTYQMDIRCSEQAIREVALDLQEGADMIMIKPGSMYLDVISQIRSTFHVPTFAYHVSGEYAMLKAASNNDWLCERSAVMELMYCLKRAGSHGIVTYYARDVAQWLQQ